MPTTQKLMRHWAALDSGKADTTDLDALSATVAGHTAQLAQKGNCRIEILTYTGNGNCGSYTPNYLTFSAMPAAFLIAGNWAICVGRGGGRDGHSDSPGGQRQRHRGRAHLFFLVREHRGLSHRQ